VAGVLKNPPGDNAAAQSPKIIILKPLTADALLTQRRLADYPVEHKAYYHLTVKGNQSGPRKDLILYFQDLRRFVRAFEVSFRKCKNSLKISV
jgi:hypothetical protein